MMAFAVVPNGRQMGQMGRAPIVLQPHQLQQINQINQLQLGRLQQVQIGTQIGNVGNINNITNINPQNINRVININANINVPNRQTAATGGHPQALTQCDVPV